VPHQPLNSRQCVSSFLIPEGDINLTHSLECNTLLSKFKTLLWSIQYVKLRRGEWIRGCGICMILTIQDIGGLKAIFPSKRCIVSLATVQRFWTVAISEMSNSFMTSAPGRLWTTEYYQVFGAKGTSHQWASTLSVQPSSLPHKINSPLTRQSGDTWVRLRSLKSFVAWYQNLLLLKSPASWFLKDGTTCGALSLEIGAVIVSNLSSYSYRHAVPHGKFFEII